MNLGRLQHDNWHSYHHHRVNGSAPRFQSAMEVSRLLIGIGVLDISSPLVGHVPFVQDQQDAHTIGADRMLASRWAYFIIVRSSIRIVCSSRGTNRQQTSTFRPESWSEFFIFWESFTSKHNAISRHAQRICRKGPWTRGIWITSSNLAGIGVFHIHIPCVRLDHIWTSSTATELSESWVLGFPALI